MQKASVAYMQTQITTTNQGELLLMLYAGAIKFLIRAKEEIEKKNFAEKGMLISKAMDIIAELDGSLNMERGGELSKNLHQLYMFCNSHLLKASIKMNAKFIDDVVNILEGLRSAYAQIINTPEAVSALEEAPHQDAVDATPRAGGSRLFNDPTDLQAPSGPAMAGVSARAQSAAYIQQAQAAQNGRQAESGTAQVQAAPAVAATMSVAPNALGSASEAAAQVKTNEAAKALDALAKQVVPSAPQSAQDVVAPAPQAAQPLLPQTPPAGFGFAKQMTGNSLYRKMSGQA